MIARTVTDIAGRVWNCASESTGAVDGASAQGRDVVLACATPSVEGPVNVTVGWQWESMSAPGLARLVSQASPVARR